ncbi:hypothetical protein DH2020_039720 [Rehmannia glutinosa]|uniref:RING-type domain-containing protein n=1 Tax=Rehmannia glutinosa TaxID=99300 RepID=A0ABR0UVS2_REHGL
MEKCCHVEYKRLKKVLKRCRRCRDINDSSSGNNGEEDGGSQYCQFESCSLCDQMFFTELMKEASSIAGCFRSRASRLLQFHIHNGLQRYFTFLRACFATPSKLQHKSVHGSVNGRKFKSKMRSEHMEILQSPWLIELGAFYMNISQSNGGNSDEQLNPFSFDLTSTEPTMTLLLPDSEKLEYSLTCAICLELVFNPYALSCGHLFCKSCVCSAASVMIFQGPKDAPPESKCPVCREVGVYCNAVHMMELDTLMKKECLKPLCTLFLTLCLLVPETSAKSIDVHLCAIADSHGAVEASGYASLDALSAFTSDLCQIRRRSLVRYVFALFPSLLFLLCRQCFEFSRLGTQNKILEH